MRTIAGSVSLSFGLVLIISVVGCGTRTTPPGATIIGTSAPGMNIAFLRWKEGLTVLFVDDVKGTHSSGGSGSTENSVHTAIVSVASPDTGGYKCQLETKDGKSANCRINGKDYDLSKGTLFVIKAKGEQVEVHQLKRDLTTIPFDADDCKEPIQKDAEIRKLLGLGDSAPAPKAPAEEPEAPKGEAITDPVLREAREQADAILAGLFAGKFDEDQDMSDTAKIFKKYESWSIKSQKLVRDGAADFRGILNAPGRRFRFRMSLVQRNGKWAIAAFDGHN